MINVEFFYSGGSVGSATAYENLMVVLQKTGIRYEIKEYNIRTTEDAIRSKVTSVPTVRINGVDVDAYAGYGYSPAQRVYKENGKLLEAPTKTMILKALNRHLENPVICFCRGVRKKSIIEALKTGAVTFKDVQDSTGASTDNECETKNPAGRCCAPFIIEIIKGFHGGVADEVPNNCCKGR